MAQASASGGLACQIPGCIEVFKSGKVTSTMIWQARIKKWGILEDPLIIHCPDHKIRKTTRPPVPPALDGQLELFDLPARPVESNAPRRGRKKEVQP